MWVKQRVPTRFLLFLGPLLALHCAPPQSRLDRSEWRLYTQRFITPEGRVVDTGNNNVSHSEGQGYGMLLAVAYHDTEMFERVWNWTRQHLQIRTDKLFAWRWVPSRNGGGVDDLNNASDGDLIIAWALARAAAQWNISAYAAAAKEISQEIRAKLFQHTQYGLALLPGAAGFNTSSGTTVNLSYWVFPALAALRDLDPAPEWDQLIHTGEALLRAARFGRWQLPPDWLVVHDTLMISPDFKPIFGYNAIRIPLYLIWAKRAETALLQPYLDFWNYFTGAQFVPAWTNLHDSSVDSYDASPGIHAIIQFVRSRSEHGNVTPASLPVLTDQQDYYSASLLLLTKVALQERNGS